MPSAFGSMVKRKSCRASNPAFQVQILVGLLIEKPNRKHNPAQRFSRGNPVGNRLSIAYDSSLECAGFAREPAKLVDQVRFLARTLDLTPKPEGPAAASNAASSGFNSRRRP
jgi:hypothetical protein